MNRILEPELMEDIDQVIAYSKADFKSSNQLFLDHILKENVSHISNLIDLGCGPADLTLELAVKLNVKNTWAVDGSKQMCELAQKAVINKKLENKVKIVHERIPDLSFNSEKIDMIVSKDLLHHIPDPIVFWDQIERLSQKDTKIYVMDLLRPESEKEARSIVENVSAHEADVLKTDFYNSLLAAFTMEEIKHQLEKTNFKYTLKTLGDRHFVVCCYNIS